MLHNYPAVISRWLEHKENFSLPILNNRGNFHIHEKRQWHFDLIFARDQSPRVIIFFEIYNLVAIPMSISSVCRLQKLVCEKPIKFSVKNEMAI